MSTAIAVPSIAAAAPTRKANYTRAFAGLFLRDLYVLRRELGTFLIRVVMNPLLFLFVFTYIMPHMSGGASMNPTAQMSGAGAGINFSTVLVPGLMAVAIMFPASPLSRCRSHRNSASRARSTTASCVRCPSPPSVLKRSSSVQSSPSSPQV